MSSNLPRLVSDHPVFNVQGVLPAEYTISVITTENALQRIKINKAVGPDNTPACILKDNASILTAIFNSSLREGFIIAMWKAANVESGWC